jgi:hypothetical protein
MKHPGNIRAALQPFTPSCQMFGPNGGLMAMKESVRTFPLDPRPDGIAETMALPEGICADPRFPVP